MEHMIPPKLLGYILVKRLTSTIIGKTLKIPGYAYVTITLFLNPVKLNMMYAPRQNVIIILI